MTDRHSNEEFNFGSLASSFADEPAPKKESAGPAKITKANVAATAPAVEAAVPAVEPASAPALPPMPAASMPPMPPVENPAQTPGFWGSALASSLPNLLATGIGGAGLAAYGLSKRGQSGGQGLQAPPTVDEDLRQLRLAQEQAKLESMYAKEARQQELHAANLARSQPAAQTVAPSVQAAPTGMPSTTQQFSVSGQPQPTVQYGQQKTNAPTGVPSPIPAPAGQAAAVQPPPMSEFEKIRLEKARVELQAAKDKAEHDAAIRQQKLADQQARTAKKDAENLSKLQGASADEVNMLKRSDKAGIEKAAESSVKSAVKANPPVAGAAVPAPSPVVVEAATQVNAPAPTAKQASKIKEITLPPEWKGKGMNWLSSAVGIEGAKQFIDIYNNGKPFNTHDEMKAVYDKVMVKPSYSTIPKSTRQDRGITSGEREQYKIVPGAVAPPSGGGGGAGPVIRGGGGGATGIGRAGEEIHNLNPLKL